MRLRWLLIALFTMSLVPSVAAARSAHHVNRPAGPAYTIGAAFEPGAHAGKLVLAFYNQGSGSIELPIRVVADTIQYDWLTVEVMNAHATRTLRFIADRDESAVEYVTLLPGSTTFERIDLDPLTRDLPPGQYDVRVTWADQMTMTRTTVPYHCGLYYASLRSASPEPPVPPSPSPSKLPFLLGGFAFAALLVATWLEKRAGTPVGCVPCSAP